MSFLRSMYAAGSNVRHTLRTNKIVGANDGERLGFARKLRVVLRHRPGVAQLHSPHGEGSTGGNRGNAAVRGFLFSPLAPVEVWNHQYRPFGLVLASVGAEW